MTHEDRFQVAADRVRLGPRLQPFRADPVLRWFLRQPAWLTPAVFLALYGLLALCSWLDGTFWRIESPPGRYPDEALIVPFVREYFGPVFVLLFFPALVLYARVLDGRIRHTVHLLYERSILDAGRHPPGDYASRWQRRFDSRWAWLASALFSAWFLAYWIAARLGYLDDSLGIIVHVASREAVFGFVWILLFSLLGPHLFMAVVWRVWVCSSRIHNTFVSYRDIRLQPLHPDNCCGLRFVGDFILLTSGFIAFFPLFLALLLWFYPAMLDNVVTGYGLIYAGVVVYVVIATFAFVYPTYSAHRLMFREREAAMNVLNQRFFTQYEQVFRKLAEQEVDAHQAEDQIKLLNNIREYYREVRSRAIWPFNLRVVTEFVGVIGVPILLLFLERILT